MRINEMKRREDHDEEGEGLNEKIMLLLCVAKGRQSLSRGMISDVVRGCHSVRVFSRRLYINSTFGSLKGYTKKEVEDKINQLIEQGLLEETADEYPRLILTDAGKKELHEYAAKDSDVDRDSAKDKQQLFREIRKYIDDNYIGSVRGLSYGAPSFLVGSADQIEEGGFPDAQSSRQARSSRPDQDSMPDESSMPVQGSMPDDSLMSDESSMPLQSPMPAKSSRPPHRARQLKKSSEPKFFSQDFPDIPAVDEESFHDMLFRLIDESGMAYPQVYTRANMDKKLFSKIKNNPDSIPKKKNIIALAIALRLDMEQTNELLMKAGYALSNSFKADVIVSYFIEHRRFDVFEINEALFEFGQEKDLLGF